VIREMSHKHPVHPLRIAFWCLLVGAVLLIAPFHRVKISGNSMYPTLKNGENYVADRLYWRWTGLERNDIVIFREGKDEVVKRLVGLPSDILQLEYSPDGRQIVHVRNLTVNPKLRQPPAANRRDYIVPIGRLFVLGDNYNRSDDSRRFGGVPIGNVYGVLRTLDMRRRFPRPAGQ
jgi:signal peptidase I